MARSPGCRRLLQDVARTINAAARGPGNNGDVRRLYVMSRSLVDLPPVEDEEALSSYETGRDDLALLDLIARAYWWHPDEQWDARRLAGEVERRSFSPHDLQLYRRDDELEALCWTKLLDGPGEPKGLLLMVGVNPARRGRGLGRKIVIAGLHHLRRQGVDEALLYVDTTNVRAVRLYVALGFEVVHTEHRFHERPLTVPPTV